MFVNIRNYSYLTDDDKNVKEVKGTKKCVIERMLIFNDYKNCLFKNEIILPSRQILVPRTSRGRPLQRPQGVP